MQAYDQQDLRKCRVRPLDLVLDLHPLADICLS